MSGTPSAESPPRAEPPKAEPPKAERTAGIDASHHQGDIGWNQVADHGIGFAYLKATEGSSFEDPAFADNWAAARAAGIRTGGYHYYTLCSAPEPQAD
ncbi:MAG: hypothetical protein L0H93_14620, partial [Nocardioides sp.]|nr:hypothetical protein [Nocardioides sp.]